MKHWSCISQTKGRESAKKIPERENFPKRNRIIAGFCDAVIVVEAGQRGGALITAEIANSYNRDVFAVPGKLDDEYSLGCNTLIKSNKAALIQSAKDVKYIMLWEESSKKKSQQKTLFPVLQGWKPSWLTIAWLMNLVRN